MTPLSSYYLQQVRSLAPLYFKLVESTLRGRETPWERLRASLNRVLHYGDLRAAAVIRWNALREPLKQRHVKSLDEMRAENPWYDLHSTQTTPAIENRAVLVADLEKKYWLAKAKGGGIRPGTEHKEIADYRLREQFRTAISDVTNTSEQLELANPDVSNAFPFWVYETREDQRVRPTHAAMDGFIAVNSWRGWLKIRPPDGFNCRCTITYKTIHYARKMGWIDASDKPKFEVRWPNTASRINWEKGRFPDDGFRHEKYVQLGSFGK